MNHSKNRQKRHFWIWKTLTINLKKNSKLVDLKKIVCLILRSKSRFAESVPLIFIFLNNPPYNKQFNCIAIDLIQINFFILTLATVHLLPRFQRLIKRAYVKFKCQTLERYRVDIANGARVAHLRLHGRVHFCQLINVTNCFVSILTI
jgi:hypothetical protein